MFLWSILNKSESDPARKCLTAQQLNPVKNDLITTDLEMCDITLTMTEISQMKKTTLRVVSRKYLLDLKTQHSKLKFISDRYEFEPYLLSKNLSTEEKQILFKLRTRMVDVKLNFKTQYGQNLACNFCPEMESQSHLLTCKQLTNDIDLEDTEYNDIFQDISKQEKVASIFNRILRKRSTLLKQYSNTCEPLLQNTQSL